MTPIAGAVCARVEIKDIIYWLRGLFHDAQHQSAFCVLSVKRHRKMNDCQWTFISYLSVCHVCIIIEHIFALRTQMNSTNSIRCVDIDVSASCFGSMLPFSARKNCFVLIFIFFCSRNDHRSWNQILAFSFSSLSLSICCDRTSSIRRRIHFEWTFLIEIIWLGSALATRAHEFKIN